LEEDKLTADALTVAFKTLSNDADFVTENDMLKGGMPVELVELMKTHLPKRDNGYDYSAFLKEIFI
jgi:hypothetical protein